METLPLVSMPVCVCSGLVVEYVSYLSLFLVISFSNQKEKKMVVFLKLGSR